MCVCGGWRVLLTVPENSEHIITGKGWVGSGAEMATNYG